MTSDTIEKIYILTHTDLDGYMSGGLAKYFYLKFDNPTAEFKIKHWTYGRDLPDVNYIKKKFNKIFILDLCPDTDFMLTLYEHFKENLIWIDHHILPDNTFLTEFKEKYLNETVAGLRAKTEHTEAGISLTWKYFVDAYKEHTWPSTFTHIPEWIKLTAEFDAWIRPDETRWAEKVMPFFTYMKGKVRTADEAYELISHLAHTGSFFDVLTLHGQKNEEVDSYIKIGKIMYTELRNIYDAEAKHGFERFINIFDSATNTVTTLKAWICNTQNRSSVIFETMENKDDYDVFIPFHYNGEKYFYSMYTFKEDIHCNEMTIVKDYSGFLGEPDIVSTPSGLKKIVLTFRGHKDAAGANSTELVFS